MAKELKTFLQYLKEQEEKKVSMDEPLKGYKSDEIIQRLEELMQVLSDNTRFGVPTNNLARATTYRDANGAIQKIRDLQLEYDNMGEEVRFYCWSIMYNGSWKATQNLKAKIKDAGGFGEEDLNMNLQKLIDYFTQNAEDSDNVGSISISIDSIKVREERNKSKNSETSQDLIKKETDDLGTNEVETNKNSEI